MRSDPGAQQEIQRLIGLCTEATPGTLRRVAEAPSGPPQPIEGGLIRFSDASHPTGAEDVKAGDRKSHVGGAPQPDRDAIDGRARRPPRDWRSRRGTRFPWPSSSGFRIGRRVPTCTARTRAPTLRTDTDTRTAIASPGRPPVRLRVWRRGIALRTVERQSGRTARRSRDRRMSRSLLWSALAGLGRVTTIRRTCSSSASSVYWTALAHWSERAPREGDGGPSVAQVRRIPGRGANTEPTAQSGGRADTIRPLGHLRADPAPAC